MLEEYFKADSSRFTTSGREDIDVRMLGTGRPFAVQLLNCRRLKPLNSLSQVKTLFDLQKKINEDIDIQIRDLCRVTSKEAQILNVGQEGEFAFISNYSYFREEKSLLSCLLYPSTYYERDD